MDQAQAHRNANKLQPRTSHRCPSPHADGYVEVLIADRGERVRAEPCDAIELSVGVQFGDDAGA